MVSGVDDGQRVELRCAARPFSFGHLSGQRWSRDTARNVNEFISAAARLQDMASLDVSGTFGSTLNYAISMRIHT